MQAVPLFLSEIAPTRIRGGLNILFQLNVTIGIRGYHRDPFRQSRQLRNCQVSPFLESVVPDRSREEESTNSKELKISYFEVLVVLLVSPFSGENKIKGGWGWRLSLGLAGIPAVLLTAGALFVVETPNSLIERGRHEEGKAVLRKIRGTDNIEPEFLELLEASRIAQEVKHPFKNLMKRRNRPQLVIAIAMQVSGYLLRLTNLFFSINSIIELLTS